MAEVEPVSPSGAASEPRAANSPPDIQVKVSWCKGCGLCVEYCNRGALGMRDGLPVVLQAERCSRCLMCEAICPDFAISVLDLQPGPAGDREEGQAT